MNQHILWYIIRKLIQAMSIGGACLFFLLANSIMLYAMSVCFVGVAFCMDFLKPYGSTRKLKSELTHIELDSDDEIKLVHQIKTNW